MISLGIDASVRSTGVTLLTANSCLVKNIKPPSSLKEGGRLHYILKEWEMFVEKTNPDIVVMEGPSYGSTNKAYLMGEVYGLFKASAFKKWGLTILTPSPKELKKYLCAAGDASKSLMTERALSLGCTLNQEDVCDSFAAALLGLDVLNNENTPKTRKSQEVINKYSLKVFS